MQHDQTAGLQTCKCQPGQESKMASSTKISKTIKINLFSQMAWLLSIFGRNFGCSSSGTLVFIDIKIKKSVAKSGHNDHLKIYIDPSKIYIDPSKIYFNLGF